MTHRGGERRLSAIMAADVVGFTGLMAIDEDGVLERLKSLRSNVFDPVIAEYGGRVVKLMGDGALVEFASVVDSVGCAAEIQRALAACNADLPEESRIILRIGINIGDVIVDGEDIYGDGVNIAARLEEIAEPGGVCLSADAWRQARGKLDLDFEDMGERKVKNVCEPLHVYRVAPAGVGGAAIAGAAHASPDKPSIAVLPFENMSGDPEQDYFADGISEDLITALSKIRWFFVIARNSTFTYKGAAVKVKQVARELGVQYVLEGSVRKAGNRVRISAQLIDAVADHHVWAEHYDRDLDDIFALQDEMTQTIVGAVEPEMSAVEREQAAHKPPESLDAWESYQRGLWCLWSFTEERLGEARALFRRAQSLDPGFASAFAYESYSHYLDAILGYSKAPTESVAAGIEAGRKSLALDDKDPVAYFAIGRALMLRGEHDDSLAHLNKSLSINPSFSQARHGLGMVLALAGRLDESARELDEAIRLSPRDPLRFATEAIRSLTCTLQHKHEEAVEWARKSIREPQAAKGGYFPFATLASALANLDRLGEAREALAAAYDQKPDLTLAYVIKTVPTKKPGGIDIYLEGLRKAGLTE